MSEGLSFHVLDAGLTVGSSKAGHVVRGNWSGSSETAPWRGKGDDLRFTNKVLGKLSKLGQSSEEVVLQPQALPFFPCGGSVPPGHPRRRARSLVLVLWGLTPRTFPQ